MNDNFEPVMSAQFAHLVAAAQINFAADAVAGTAVLSNASPIMDLFPGLPVFGPGVDAGTLVQSVDIEAGTVTLSTPVSQDGGAVAFTTGFLTWDRRVEHWTKVANQPALFFRRIGVTDEEDGHFIKTTLECEAWIYSNAGKDPTIAPDSVLTGLERLVRRSFAPDGDYGDPRFTLGGLVYWSRIAGRADISPGDQGPQAIARIPVRITLP
jgi:hypothetical protein